MRFIATGRAFAVSSATLDRWDVASFRRVVWSWPAHVIRPLGRVLRLRRKEVEETVDRAEVPIIEKISFAGKVSLLPPEKRTGYKGRLYWAKAGDIIYSKIRVKQGSIAVVPQQFNRIAVSLEYPVFEVDPELAIASFVEMVVRSSPFMHYLDGVSHGGSTKTRVSPGTFTNLSIPIPQRETQAAILTRAGEIRNRIEDERQEIRKAEEDTEAAFLAALGLSKGRQLERPRMFAVSSSNLDRWSVAFNQFPQSDELARGKFPVADLANHLVSTMNGYSIKPVNHETHHRMLRLSALSPGGLDLTKVKYVDVTPAVAERFHIRKDDLLICRSVGSHEQIAKCAVVPEDHPDILFPDIMIRARLKGSVLAEFAREIIQSSVGRAWFQRRARTAVGMWKIGGADIARFPIPLPPLQVQKELVEDVSARRERVAMRQMALRDAEQDAKMEIEMLVLGRKRPGG